MPFAFYSLPGAQSEITTDCLIALAPNVEALRVRIHGQYDESGAIVSSFLQTRLSLLGPGSRLCQLHSLDIVAPGKAGHQYLLCHPSVVTCIQAAPNIQHLKFSEILCPVHINKDDGLLNMARRSSFHKLRSLTFDQSTIHREQSHDMRNCYGFQLIQELCDAAPRLTMFRFSCDEEYEHYAETPWPLPASGFLNALKPRRKGLRSLHLDLSTLFGDPARVTIGPLLANFARLDTLAVHEAWFCDQWSSAFFGEPHHIRSCLASILPPTILNLTLILKSSSSAWFDVRCIGLAIRNGNYPMLQRVTTICPDVESDEPDLPEEAQGTLTMLRLFGRPLDIRVEKQRDDSTPFLGA